MAKISYNVDGPSAAINFIYENENSGDVDCHRGKA